MTTEKTAFPVVPRVVYADNPLVDVLAQLRFPPVLRVDAELPTAFQDALRSDYPEVQQTVMSLHGPATTGPGLQRTPAPTQSRYEFISSDSAWRVALTRDFVALTTTSYRRWEEFHRRLQSVVEVLGRVYKVPYLSRIGLRYRDVVLRSKLGLEGSPWSSLLRRDLLGALAVEELTIQEATSRFVAPLPYDQSKMIVSHGLAEHPEFKELGYLIDADFFTSSRVTLEDYSAVISRFNRESGRFFRWCITDILHEAMRPGVVGE
ncbi:MAG: TIGR04255 family protein [Sandaracinus sp.]|nr:TIGR04255 family protein [Sandaracinus sp.]